MREQISPSGFLGGWIHRYTDELWLAFRVIFAAIVFYHAIDKAMWLNPAGQGASAAFVDIFGAIELISALLIAFGFLTRIGACAIILTAIIGYIAIYAQIDILSAWTHLDAAPQQAAVPLNVMAELGEDTILWFIIATAIAVIGGGKYAIERKIFKMEVV